MRKRFGWVLLLLLACPTLAAAQISSTYVFTSGTIINPDEVNANFALLANALNRTGGTMTGTLTARAIIFGTDNTYDIGASGATRPRDFFLARNATIGGTLTVNGSLLGTAAFISSTAGGDLSGTLPSPTVAKVNGATYPASPSAHQLPVITSASSGGTATYKTLPDCQDSAGNHLNYTQSSDAFACGTTTGNILTYTAKTGTYSATAGDYVDCTSGTFTVTLPASSSNTNKIVVVVNSGSGTITIARTGSDTIGNQAETSQTLNPGDGMFLFSSGTGLWRIS